MIFNLLFFTCFDCFRGCPKAYHPACVKRGEEFFRATDRWSCGMLIFPIFELYLMALKCSLMYRFTYLLMCSNSLIFLSWIMLSCLFVYRLFVYKRNVILNVQCSRLSYHLNEILSFFFMNLKSDHCFY